MLVAHSYGGAVISNVGAGAGDIVGLVYVNGFAPEAGESCFQLAGMFPGSMLGEATVQPVPHGDGTTDLYVAADPFHDIFCADVPAPQAALMAVTQRPATQEALVEPSGERPLWKRVPSWFLIGEEDRAAVVLEPASQAFVEATANPPFLYELPAGARVVLDDVQAAPNDKLAVEDRWITVPAMPRRAQSPGAARPHHLQGAQA